MYKNKNGKFVETQHKWFLNMKRTVWLAGEIRRCHWYTCAGMSTLFPSGRRGREVLDSTSSNGSSYSSDN